MLKTLRQRPFALTLGLFLALALFGATFASAAAPPRKELPKETYLPVDDHEGGVLEPMTAATKGVEVRIPNTDQSADGDEQSSIHGEVVWSDAYDMKSLMGHEIQHVASPNDDLRLAMNEILTAASAGDKEGMQGPANDILDILHGTTEGRIYDGFNMLNYNRDAFLPDHLPGEYKMKWARDSGETAIDPFSGEELPIYEVDIAMLYYDGNIDADTFLLRFPHDANWDAPVRVNYKIYSLVNEDFSPTLVMLDKRLAMNTVQFPFKGFDAVWLAFTPGQVMEVSIDYPPNRMLRGVYTWGWRVHPPRIQFLQPVYEIVNAHTGEIELDPQGKSYATRNRENLTIDNIGEAAPEKKMMRLAEGVLEGAEPVDVIRWMTDIHEGPYGTWVEWADLAKEQRQLPREVWDMLEPQGISRSDFGPYRMITAFMNNEMYGEGPFENDIFGWDQQEEFEIILLNLDNHTHYFRNVDFGTRLNEDILDCCGGGQTSFEIMNFKPSYGAPKVAEMQWRAGWGFRPHYDVVQQHGVFSRGSDRVKLKPYTSGLGYTYYGYQYSEEKRGGDFLFSPPGFVIIDEENPAPFSLREVDAEEGVNGLVIGQFTEGYGTQQMCPDDPYPGFCQSDISQYNPNGAFNWPAPADPTVPKTELRFPPFLRNPAQGQAGAGDIIPPTGAWRPFLWINPNNGTLYVDPEDPSQGYWADLTYGHGAPVYPGGELHARIELPRASGQVFYQFDDLFHDNAIFSPHPLFEGEDEFDSVKANAFMQNGTLRVRGKVSKLRSGSYASWVTIYAGDESSDRGCTGEVLGSVEVDQSNGTFVLRCGNNNCLNPRLKNNVPQTDVCVQSGVGGYLTTDVAQ